MNERETDLRYLTKQQYKAKYACDKKTARRLYAHDILFLNHKVFKMRYDGTKVAALNDYNDWAQRHNQPIIKRPQAQHNRSIFGWIVATLGARLLSDAMFKGHHRGVCRTLAYELMKP